MKPYDHKKIEKKWQKAWEEKEMYRASDTSESPKFYPLVEFPFPSGAGLHTGHVRSYTAMDIVARKRRAEGMNVLYPIGWDAFGLPTENYAIKTGEQPEVVTKKNTDTYRNQLKALGLSFDWSREVNTTDPAFYKWTQWIFLQMYKEGLAYKAKMNINWCPKDKIGLANEEVIDGCCERCGTPVEKREKEQWMLAITKYADRLDKDLDTVDYLPRIKNQQRNWIGKSEGAELHFKIKDSSESIHVFTTRADTLFGVTYVVLAPEHELVSKLSYSNTEEVQKYITEVKNKADIERTAEGKEKNGIELKGVSAIHPITGEYVPIWIADYVLASYGTGAVMAVPAHDERDFAFATKYNLPIKEVIRPYVVDHVNPPKKDKSSKIRRNIHAIVYDPKQDKYLILRNTKFGWDTVIIGGVEDGEDLVEAAKREVEEETGYTDLEFKRILGNPVQAAYFAKHKDENRVAISSALFFELKSEAKVEIPTDGENEGNEVMWISKEEFVPGKMVNSELSLWLARLHAKKDFAYTEDGILVNSESFDGKSNTEAISEIIESAGGKKVTKFKLRDWVFSRQRYWGEPIPLIHCDSCGWIPVPEKDLPLLLPKVEKYEPTDNGESPLANVESWVNVPCPTCKAPAKRETDTMPQWAGSSWYYLRYTDPKNETAFASKENLEKWTPVDWYNGGMEHTTLHLLYSRFWHKFLFDIGVVPTSEPYKKRTAHGMVLADGGEKMSKSKGNVVNPDELIEKYGADTLRLYEMFMGPFDQAIAWNSGSMVGSYRFIERIWNLQEKVSDSDQTTTHETEILTNQTIKKVGEDIESMSFNTAVSTMMIYINHLEKSPSVSKTHYSSLLQLLAPFAPFVTDEIWASLGNEESIHTSTWPSFDTHNLISNTAKIVIQVNGKIRATIELERDTEEKIVKEKSFELPEVAKWIADKNILKVIYVKNKLINIVVEGS